MCHTSVFSPSYLIWALKKLASWTNFHWLLKCADVLSLKSIWSNAPSQDMAMELRVFWEKRFTLEKVTAISEAHQYSGYELGLGLAQPSCYFASPLWGSLISQSLSFFFCHMWIIIVLTSLGCWEDWKKTMYIMLNTMPGTGNHDDFSVRNTSSSGLPASLCSSVMRLAR